MGSGSAGNGPERRSPTRAIAVTRDRAAPPYIQNLRHTIGKGRGDRDGEHHETTEWTVASPLPRRRRPGACPTLRPQDRRHALARLGDRSTPLAKIEHSAIAAWIVDLLDGGLAGPTVRHAHRVLHMILNAAVDDGRLVRNPASRVKLPRDRRREKRFLRLLADFGGDPEAFYEHELGMDEDDGEHPETS